MLGEREAMASMILALASLWKSIENYRLSQGGKKKEVHPHKILYIILKTHDLALGELVLTKVTF